MLAATAVGTRMGPAARVDATSISNGLPIQKDQLWPPQLSAEFRPRHLNTCYTRHDKERTRLVVALLIKMEPAAPYGEKSPTRYLETGAITLSMCTPMYSPTVTAAHCRVAGHASMFPRQKKLLNGVRGFLRPCKMWALASAGDCIILSPVSDRVSARRVPQVINLGRF